MNEYIVFVKEKEGVVHVPLTIPTTRSCKSDVRFEGHTCRDLEYSSKTESPIYALIQKTMRRK
jgi:hypothetical protein